MTLLVIIILGLTLFIASFRWKDILLSTAAALVWGAIGFWWMIAGGPPGFETTAAWGPLITYVPFLLAFVVLLRLMNTEIIHEASGKNEKMAWTEWGSSPPARRTLSNYERYKRDLHRRLQGR